MKKQSNTSKKETPLTWETFEEFILTEGLARYKKALEEVDEYTYLKLYPSLLEFIKPKIKRAENLGSTSDISRIVVVWDEDKKPTHV